MSTGKWEDIWHSYSACKDWDSLPDTAREHVVDNLRRESDEFLASAVRLEGSDSGSVGRKSKAKPLSKEERRDIAACKRFWSMVYRVAADKMAEL